MTWHYGTVGPVNHTKPDGPTGWSGIHGALTPNRNHVCDECAADFRANYPHHTLPDLSGEDSQPEEAGNE